MADCNSLFHDFNSNLQITTTKRKSLMTSKDTLREVIIKWFKKNQPSYVPKFFIQGSYKAKTLIRTKEDLCDLDDGIHFECEPDVTPTQLKEWVYEAIKDHTTGGAQNKTKCVRVIYKGDYHIDLPVYKNAEDDDFPWLAVKYKSWDEEESDPKGFVSWHNKNKTHQLTKIVRYLKSWGDTVRDDMLSGLAMTLLAHEYIVEDDNDDVALRDTLEAIKEGLKDSWSLTMPVKPEDDIIAHHESGFRTNFFTHLDAVIEDANSAIDSDSQLKASQLWRKHLGSRFPLGEDEKDESKSNYASLMASSTSAVYKPYADE